MKKILLATMLATVAATGAMANHHPTPLEMSTKYSHKKPGLSLFSDIIHGRI